MRSVLLESIGRLTITDVEAPTLEGPTEVLIQVKAVGICGSEIHAFQGTHPFRKPPTVLGHEVCGDVIEVGVGVDGFSPGDRVFVDPQWPCGVCRWCRSGQHNLCPSKKVLGTTQWSGGLGEVIVAPVQSVYHLPDGLSYVEGTLIEPLSVGVHMVSHVGVQQGEAVAVLGAGPIGMMVAAVASVRGAEPIIAVDVQPHCLKVIQAHFGATHGLLAQEGPVSGRALGLTGGRGMDVAFLTVGVPSLVDEALAMAERQGRIMFVALFDRPVQFDVDGVIHKDLTLLGSSMYDRRDIEAAAELVASRRVPAGAMVTHVLPLEEAQRGFDMAATKADGAIKVVLEFR